MEPELSPRQQRLWSHVSASLDGQTDVAHDAAHVIRVFRWAVHLARVEGVDEELAGAAALYLEANPTATPQQVRDALFNATTKDIVTNSRTANNHLLFSEAGDEPPPPAEFTLEGTTTPLSGGRWRAELTWDGADGNRVDIYRDGTKATATRNDGSQRFTIRASGTVMVKVCETNDPTTCSNEVELDFTG